MQNLTSWVEESLLPFMGLFALHQFVENFYSFLQLSLLLISTASSTLHLQAFVATPPEHKLQKSRDVLILVTLNIWALSLLGLPDKNVWRAAFFLLPMRSFSVWCCLVCQLSVLSPTSRKLWYHIRIALSSCNLLGHQLKFSCVRNVCYLFCSVHTSV